MQMVHHFLMRASSPHKKRNKGLSQTFWRQIERLQLRQILTIKKRPTRLYLTKIKACLIKIRVVQPCIVESFQKSNFLSRNKQI